MQPWESLDSHGHDRRRSGGAYAALARPSPRRWRHPARAHAPPARDSHSTHASYGESQCLDSEIMHMLDGMGQPQHPSLSDFAVYLPGCLTGRGGGADNAALCGAASNRLQGNLSRPAMHRTVIYSVPRPQSCTLQGRCAYQRRLNKRCGDTSRCPACDASMSASWSLSVVRECSAPAPSSSRTPAIRHAGERRAVTTHASYGELQCLDSGIMHMPCEHACIVW
jgi:hypothetical protein